MIPHSHQVEHLILLVGGNPLPLAIAGWLLVHNDVGRPCQISLIHSAETYPVAQRLQQFFSNREAAKPHRRRIPSVRLYGPRTNTEPSLVANPDTIKRYVKQALETVLPDDVQQVGVHYSGGTKTMAVYAVLTVTDWYEGVEVRPIFSYLEARNQLIHCDPAFDTPPLPVGGAIHIPLPTLLYLHNWELRIEKVISHPRLPALARQLARSFATDTDKFHNHFATLWGNWLQKDVRKQHRLHRSKQLLSEQSLPLSATDESLVKIRSDDLKTQKSYTNLVRQQKLAPIFTILSHQYADQEATLPLANMYPHFSELGTDNENGCLEFLNWLEGKWLENYVLDSLSRLPTEWQLQLYANVRAQLVGGRDNNNFEMDVIAIRGYQLFAFSCSTANPKDRGVRGRLKQKLIEARMRARQLAGDEARAALVCFWDDMEDDPDRADDLLAEVQRDVEIATGRVMVFGRKSFFNPDGKEIFVAEIGRWIVEQCKIGQTI